MKPARKKETGNKISNPISDRWLFALLVVPLIVYLHGLAPSVVAGDTGDFLTSGWIWGVAHPPGYPLYTMMVGIFERLPIHPFWLSSTEYSSPAWRANLLSSLTSLCTLALMFALVRRLTGNVLAGIVAAGALAFSRVFWWHSEITENDALTALFLISMMLIAVRWVQDRKAREPYLLALVIGLAISHHQSLILFVPAILIYLGISNALRFNLKQWGLFLIIFIIGFAPLIYIPLVRYKTVDGPKDFSSSAGPSEEKSVYGSPIRYFIRYVTRGIYGEIRKYSNTEESVGEDKTTTGDVLGFYVETVANDFTILGLLALMGVALGWRKKHYDTRDPNLKPKDEMADLSKGWVLLLFSYVVYLLVVALVPSGDVLDAPFYKLQTAGPGLVLPLEVIVAAFIGVGFSVLLSVAKSGQSRSRVEIPLMIIAIIAVGWNYFHNKPYADKSRNTLFHEYCKNALDSCPQDAALVVAGDEIYPFWYMKYVYPNAEPFKVKSRDDVSLIGWAGRLESFEELKDIGGAMASAMSRIASESPDREIDTTFFHSRFLETPALSGYGLVRRGILFAFEPPGVGQDLVPVSGELSKTSSIVALQPNLPDTYIWNFWGGNGIISEKPLPEHGGWLWAPDGDIQWRIGEMLLFYGSDALLKGNKNQAAGYFRQWVMVEPDSVDARKYLAEAVKP